MLYDPPHRFRLRLLAVIALTLLTSIAGLWVWTVRAPLRTTAEEPTTVDHPIVMESAEPVAVATPRMRPVSPGPRPAVTMRPPELTVPMPQATETVVAKSAEDPTPNSATGVAASAAGSVVPAAATVKESMPSAPATIEPVTPEAELFEVRADALNVRDAPSLRAPVIFSIAGGTKVPVLKVQRRWAQVQTSDGRIGWVNIKYLARPASPGR